MSGHLATARLSAYLDDELDHSNSRRIEAHVRDCPLCQRRLHGLRLVVDELQRLPPSSAPPELARAVERAATARWPTRGDQARRRGRQTALEIYRGLIPLGSAMVVAVAVWAALVADVMSRRSAPPASDPTAPSAGISAPAFERVQAGGRWFAWSGGSWWEEELLAGSRAGSAAPSPIEGSAALERAPWLAELLARGPVVLELDGVATRVEP
jgi:anti-sigma factor RsiW